MATKTINIPSWETNTLQLPKRGHDKLFSTKVTEGFLVKKTLTTLLKLGVTLGVFWWINHSVDGGLAGMLDTVKSTKDHWWALVAAVAIYIVSVYLGAWQWQIMLQNRGAQLPLKRVVHLYYTGMFFNNFILGTVAGDSFKVATLHTSENHAKAGFASTFLDRFAGLSALSIYAVVGGAIIATINIESSKEITNVLMVLLLFSSILIAISLLLFSQRIQKLFFRLLTKLPHATAQEKLRRIVESVLIDRRTIQDRHMTIQVLLLSMTIQALRISTHIFAAVALGIYAPEQLHYFFVIIPIIALVMMVPMPFGAPQLIASTLFIAAGFEKDKAFVMEMLALIAGILGSLPGAIYFIRERWGKQLDETTAPTEKTA